YNMHDTCSAAVQCVMTSLSVTYDATDNPTGTTRMNRLAAYRTAGQPGEFHGTVGTTAVGDCSAHWFTVKGNLVALGNYEQGTRILDISDPTNPQQVGWYRVPACTADPRGKADIISSDTAGRHQPGHLVYA